MECEDSVEKARKTAFFPLKRFSFSPKYGNL